MNDEFNSNLPTELQEIAQSVDALSAAERESAPIGLEERIHGVSISSLRPKLKLSHDHVAPQQHALLHSSPSHEYSGRRWITPLRTAAAIALFTSVGVAFLAINGRPPAPPAIATTDDWINLAAADDSVGAELDLLIADTERVKEHIRTSQPLDGGEM